MKKRYWMQAILVSCLLAAGCGAVETGNTVSVLEIPIEESLDSTENTESMGDAQKAAFPMVVEEEHTAFEDIEMEVNGNKGTIIVGTTGTPFIELLTHAKIRLAEDGWDLQIKYYDDIEQLNEDVLDSVLDAHLYAHRTYIDSYNNVNNTQLVGVVPVCYEVYGVYSKLKEDLALTSDAVVAIPKAAEKKARALLFMQDMGWITLKENVGMTAIVEDITVNDNNLQFTEYTQETLADAMDVSDYCIIGADMAIVSGLNVEDDAIRTETKNSTGAAVYATMLVTTKERAEDSKLQVLADVLASAEMKEYVSDTYEGAWELMR